LEHRIRLHYHVDVVLCFSYILPVVEIIFTNEFEGWWEGLSEDEQAAVTRGVERLEQSGVTLDYPHSTAITQSRFAIRELRIQHKGRPYRVFYAFDPMRDAVLLIGGDKTGNDRFYDEMVPVADRIWEEYLREMDERNKRGS
jgi:hypothetical protein